MILSLPWPPSVNHYYQRTPRGTTISAAGLAFRRTVASTVMVHRAKANVARAPLAIPYACRLGVTIEAFPPDRRARDLDNLNKALLDALTNAGVWVDDEQIDALRTFRRSVEAPGRVHVHIASHP